MNAIVERLQYTVIPEKTIEFEWKETVHVKQFAVLTRAVTVSWYQRFTEETGYVTYAERNCPPYHATNPTSGNFRYNVGMHGAPQAQWPACYAYMLASCDVAAFAAWLGGRMLTEAEWMAMAVRDDRIFEFQSEEDSEYQLTYSRLRRETGIAFPPRELARVDSEQCAIRVEPQLIRNTDWRQRGEQTRRTVSNHYCECRATFRVAFEVEIAQRDQRLMKYVPQ